MSEAQQLKSRGNDAFRLGRWLAAVRYYSDALEILRLIVHPSKSVYELVGVLLSNRAEARLRFAVVPGRDHETANNMLQKVVDDCETVLHSGWEQLV